MTIDEIEDEIAGIYQWWADTAGSRVSPLEAGHLADLWALFDQYVSHQRSILPPEEFEVEYGRNPTAV